MRQRNTPPTAPTAGGDGRSRSVELAGRHRPRPRLARRGIQPACRRDPACRPDACRRSWPLRHRRGDSADTPFPWTGRFHLGLGGGARALRCATRIAPLDAIDLHGPWWRQRHRLHALRLWYGTYGEPDFRSGELCRFAGARGTLPRRLGARRHGARRVTPQPAQSRGARLHRLCRERHGSGADPVAARPPALAALWVDGEADTRFNGFFSAARR